MPVAVAVDGVVFQSSTSGVSCPTGGGGNKVRFPVTYTAGNCPPAPAQIGTIDITVSVDGIDEPASRVIECKP